MVNWCILFSNRFMLAFFTSTIPIVCIQAKNGILVAGWLICARWIGGSNYAGIHDKHQISLETIFEMVVGRSSTIEIAVTESDELCTSLFLVCCSSSKYSVKMKAVIRLRTTVFLDLCKSKTNDFLIFKNYKYGWWSWFWSHTLHDVMTKQYCPFGLGNKGG